jgi:geranylgeranyl pyrophosphate synthase
MPEEGLKRAFDAVADQAPRALAEPCRSHFQQKGKFLRSKLAYASACLYGATSSAALAWATAVELLHNASLVHDDLCDKDSKRRGQRTTYRQYGEAVAVCLGDYLIAKAFEYGAKAGVGTLPHLSASIATLVGGQGAEFADAGYPNWEAYEQLAIDKTAPLLSLTVIGAAAAGQRQIPIVDVENYFRHAALCFQIINDIKNFSGSDGAEAPCSDLANCRPNAVIASFTETLPKNLNARFSLWADRIRAGEIIADAVETREWWQRLCDSDAFSDTAQRLHFHFNMASTTLARLPPELQAVIACLNQWLALELTKTQHCMSKHSDR